VIIDVLIVLGGLCGIILTTSYVFLFFADSDWEEIEYKKEFIFVIIIPFYIWVKKLIRFWRGLN